MADLLKYKRPSVTFEFDFDFSDDLVSGETISSKTATATDSSGTTVTSTIINASTISGSSVLVQLKAGTDLEDYLVVCQAVTSGSDTWEKTLELRVRDNVQRGL